jgi:serine/threonine-protein kinase
VTLVLGAVLASAYLLSQREPAAPVAATPALPVSRFVITPPAEAPLAMLGGAQLAISPDGKRIAYFAQNLENANVVLYVRELDALEARPIPGTEGRSVGNMNLFFSADGKSIGYFAPDRGGLIAVTIDGRPSIKIVDTTVAGTFLGATWTPDNTLIYSSGAQLQRVSAGGGGSAEIVMPERQSRMVAAPVLLPGGRGVLFHAVEGGSDLVGVLDLETGEEKTLVEGGANPAYTDTGHIVFARGTTLMAVPFAAAELSVTGEPVALIQGVRRTPGGATHFALSANGTLVYEPSSDDASESLAAVVWVDRAGEVAERAVSDLVTNPRDPRLSPDGTRLLLVTGVVADGDLWSYDLGGRPPIPLAQPADNRFPVWSRDSRQVTFARIEGAPELFTLPADGSVLAARSLRGPGAIGVPHVWSEAGELLLSRNPGDIVAVPADGSGEVREILASEYAEYDPALSPNGRWLAYVSDRTGETEIWVQGYPDGVPVRVSRDGGFEPQWSHDGRELFYWQGNAMMAVAVNSDGDFSFAAPMQLFSGRYFQFPAPGARTYDVASDGRFLMILPGDENTAATPASMIVVQNFTEELKERVRATAP